MKPEKILQKIVTENEYTALLPSASQNEILREALYQNRIFLFLDWKGESGQGDLMIYIKNSIKNLAKIGKAAIFCPLPSIISTANSNGKKCG